MKKILLVVVTITLFSLIFGDTIYRKSDNGIKISFSNKDFSLQENLYKIIALPSIDAEIEIKSCEISVFSKDGKFLRTENQIGNERVKITGNFVMRELFGHQIELIFQFH